MEPDAGEATADASTPAEPDCDGVAIGTREERTRYEAAEAERCRAETQTRECTEDGFGAWSGSYEAETCMETTATEECEAQSEERTRYEDAEVAFGQTCEAEQQTRTCEDGEFGAWGGSFEHDSCMVAPPENCGDVAHGESEERTRYATPSVPFGDTCEVETQMRLCEDGTFGDWSGSFEHATCAEGTAGACGDVAHGESEQRIRYASVSVPYGEACAQETQMHTCLNGMFDDWTGSFSFDDCLVDPPADCGTTPHGQDETRVRYATDRVAYGETCAQETQARTCDNGAFGDWSGSYLEVTCVVDSPADCGLIKHGEQQSRTRRSTRYVPTGNVCTSERQTQTCENGEFTAWTGTYTYAMCNSLPAGSCDVTPNGASETRIMYASAAVPGPASCTSESQTRLCTDGAFDAWTGTFTEAACSAQSGAAGSCLEASGDRCVDYAGSAHGSATVQAECEGRGGSYSSTACSTGVVVGNCEVGEGSDVIRIRYLAPLRPLAAQTDCFDQHALWSP